MSHHYNDLGQLVVDDRDRPRIPPTLKNIQEGLLLVFYINPPESQWSAAAKALQMQLTWPDGEDTGRRRQRHQAAIESVSYDPTLMQTIRYYVRERFGEWDPGTLAAVQDWLVAEHGFSAETAGEVRAPELLTLLKKNAGRAKGGSGARSSRRKTASGAPKRRISVEEANKTMLGAIELDPDRLKWSARQWSSYIACSTSTIHKTAMWKQGTKAREKAKQERTPQDRGKRKSRHYSDG